MTQRWRMDDDYTQDGCEIPFGCLIGIVIGLLGILFYLIAYLR